MRIHLIDGIARVLNEINHSANILYSKHFGSNIKCEPLLMYFNLNRKLPDEYEAIGYVSVHVLPRLLASSKKDL